MADLIDKAAAEKEFDRFVELMDLDLDPAGMDAEDRKDFTAEKDRLIKEIQKGSLAFNDDGEPMFTPQRSDDTGEIIFHEPTGASLMAMDQKRQGADVTKMYAVMADITGQPVKRFSMMKMRDLRICQAVTTLFLA